MYESTNWSKQVQLFLIKNDVIRHVWASFLSLMLQEDLEHKFYYKMNFYSTSFIQLQIYLLNFFENYIKLNTITFLVNSGTDV